MNNITATNDAFGQLLWHYCQFHEGTEIIERDDGLIQAGDDQRYFSPFRQWPPEEREAMRYVHGRVLDIGAGAGRHALYLQQKRHRVTAIDNSPLAIKLCRQRGIRDARVMPIERMKFQPDSFDTVLMMFNNFGLFGSPARAKKLLTQLHRIVAPEGTIIASSVDPRGTTEAVHLQYHQWNKRRGRLPGQLRLRVRFSNIIGPWFDYLLVSVPEMKRILRGTGWKMRKVIQTPDGPYIAIIERV